jgi:hypothetical protein
MKYNVGDLVKIKSDLKVGDNADGLFVATTMTNYRGKSAHIVYACHDNECDDLYQIDIDGKEYYWSNDCFEDTNDNEDDIRCKYIIGYKKDDSVRTFEGYIDNFHPTGKSCFLNDDGDILLLPYNLIEYIIPKKGDK